MPKISVIIPIYKVEKYLERCIDSVLAQTHRNLEIILVDDGSPDRCPEICDQYAQKDDRIKVIHKTNGGVSDARNAGVEAATGDYIGFVDPDDYIDADMYEYLLGLIHLEDADISMCEFYHCYPDKEIKINIESPILTVNSKEAIYIILESKRASVTLANKLYKREIFENGLRFRLGRVSEDAFIIVDILDRAKKVVISNKQKYYYFHRADSITTIRFNEHDYDAIDAYDYNYKRACEIDREYLEPVAKMRCCWVRFWVLDKIALAGTKNDSKRRDIIKYLKQNRSFILKNNILTRGRKLSFLTLYFSFGLYKMLVKANFKKNKGQFD